MKQQPTVLSCIQPTGQMHLGNYFGAVRNWVELQEKYRCFYGVVDYHAMTMPYDVKKLRTQTWNLIFDLLAVGIEPHHLFIQSLVPEHTELCWIFNNFTSYGQLTRMTQFKDKSAKGEDGFISAGLLDYPVLQAADILIYRASFVPVGKDQDQHLELSRDIAQRFNQQVGKEYFILPEAIHTETPKIKSPADPTRKMSKSAGEKHVISLFADEKRVRKQIGAAVTDTGSGSDEMSAGVANLFELLKATKQDDAHQSLITDYENGSLMYKDLKQSVADALVDLTQGFVERRAELNARKKEVKSEIKASSADIRKRAQETLKEVKDLVGLMNVKY
jgi:tryptophanyl-tRNA synthetase